MTLPMLAKDASFTGKDDQGKKPHSDIVQASGTKHFLSTASTNFAVSCLAKCWATLGIGDHKEN